MYHLDTFILVLPEQTLDIKESFVPRIETSIVVSLTYIVQIRVKLFYITLLNQQNHGDDIDDDDDDDDDDDGGGGDVDDGGGDDDDADDGGGGGGGGGADA